MIKLNSGTASSVQKFLLMQMQIPTAV